MRALFPLFASETRSKIREREDALASTRGACATLPADPPALVLFFQLISGWKSSSMEGRRLTREIG
jgi:hypothetical protein